MIYVCLRLISNKWGIVFPCLYMYSMVACALIDDENIHLKDVRLQFHVHILGQ